jgi:hypothetical protein
MTGPNLATRAGAAILRRRQPPAAPAPAGPGGAPGPAWPARATAVLRRHGVITLLLAAGLILRVLVMAAYRPPLIYVDTLKYLYGASPGSEPLGYTVALKLGLAVGSLGTVAAIQHLLGLAMAVALYAVLLRRGVPRWLAALAAAPVLLDAYELQMEHTVMPDVLFEAIVVAGLAVLVWRPVITVPRAAAAGLIFAAAAAVMQVGVVLVVPAVIYLLAAGGACRRALLTTLAGGLAFAAAVVGYCGVSYAATGHFWLARHQSLTGRLAASADCATLQVPPAVRALCPAPAQQALGPDWLEHSGNSPLLRNPIPAGASRGRLINNLDTAVLGQQPVRVASSVTADMLRLFGPRDQTLGVTPIARWQFQDGYPTYPPWVAVCPAGRMSAQQCLTTQQAIQKRVAPVSDLLIRPGGVIVVGVQRQFLGPFRARMLNPAYGGQAQVDRPLAAFLRSYQLDGGYTPGPLLALLAAAAAAGSLLLLSRRLRARAREPALACLLFTAAAVAVLLTPDIYEFSWRYELPVVITLVPAGVAGITALWRVRMAWKKPEGEAAAS